MHEGCSPESMHEDALSPWGPVPPSILWDEEDLDPKQSLEVHCQTLQTLIRKMAKSESPGSKETAPGAIAIVGALWATCFILNFCACQSLDQREGKSDRSMD